MVFCVCMHVGGKRKNDTNDENENTKIIIFESVMKKRK